MQISFERNRRRWLIMTVSWVFVIALVYVHATLMRDYLAIVNQLGLRGAPAASTPLRQPYPAFAADAETWVRHALSLTEGAGPQLRFTKIDNAPYGREVHWNSAWAWTIAAAGFVDHWLTDTPLPWSVERMTLWVPGLALVALTIIISGWVARRAGALAGVVVALAMVGHPRVFEGFFPSYVDHHGLLTTAVLGAMIGATLMGGGWWKREPEGGVAILPRSPEEARQHAVMSALFGAFGMWVSAASVIAPLAIIGFAGFATVVVQGARTRSSGAEFDADAWRLWGRVGACASLFFYLIEYFPFHLGFRLESNHPFYALAWWGGGELIADLGSRWLAPAHSRWANLKSLLWPTAAVLVAPLTIAVAGTRVFIVIDPFLSRLHNDYIQEFLPLWRTIRGSGWRTFFTVVGAENIPLLAAVILIAVRRRALPPTIWFCAIAGVLFTGMAWMQSRWLLNASGVQVCLALALIAYFLANVRPAVRWGAALAAVILIFVPHAITRITAAQSDVEARRVSPKDAQAALWRDVAMAIRQSQPKGDITLLTSPNSSTAVGYYGRFKTLGTLYWENAAGLKSAAAILGARSEAEAAELIKKHGVTHIAVISEEHFIDSYYRLLHPGASDSEVRKCFGMQLLVDRVVPTWLQMLPYKVPDDLSTLKVTIMLFKVAFEQTPADALYHIALAKIAMGELNAAEKDIDMLIQQTPVSYQPWLRKGELLFGREDWDGAASATINGIQRAPGGERLSLYANAASSFFRVQKYAQAVRIYEAALKEHFVPEIASYLAFVLSTAKDDTVRNGRLAVELAERALKGNENSPTFLHSAAAAYAEVGDYDKAIAAVSRAAANARMRGDTPTVRMSEARLATYAAHKPWRE